MKILIIDDSNFQRNQIKHILEKNGYETLEARDGEHGLQIIEEEQPDCIICDLLMPKMDGFEFLKILHDKKNQIPIMIISSNIQAPAKKICLMHGAKAFLNKPIVKETLLLQLKDILGSKGSL
ncbi:MAG: response regulator [Candidatus Aureabacteria bacterium]|nr:response regulator [Candidatus Auribacterota bacterium]